MIFFVGLAIFIIDQAIKMLVTINIPHGEVFGAWIRISNASNTGMAYSMRER